MARISGVDIPREKRLEISLTYIFGIGRTTAQQICDGTGIDPRHPGPRPHRRRGRPAPHLHRRRTSRSRVTCAARSQQDIKRKMEIGCYQGLRHRKGLPSTVSAPTPTPAPARARRRPSPARRRL